MYRTLQQVVQTRIQTLLQERYDLQLSNVAIELPPKIEFGEMALPMSRSNWQSASRKRRAPSRRNSSRL